MAIDNLVRSGLFICANINSVPVSHLFYADDVILIGEWSESNLTNITVALEFFHRVSGLKINIEKSSILGVGIKKEEVVRLASKYGCKQEDLPFKYLGIPIGSGVGRVNTWDPIVTKFQKKLSFWKANLLSIGGRATLVSSVLGALGVYFLSLFRLPKQVNSKLESMRSAFFWGSAGGSANHRKMAWVKWGDVVADKQDGGVGIGSLDALNLSLLYKWRWRALTSPECLWVRVLKAIHGADCFSNCSSSVNGLWAKISLVIKQVHSIPSVNGELVTREVGNGFNTRFWKDIWVGNTSFAVRFPRLFALELDKDCLIKDRIVDSTHQWNWRRQIRAGRELDQFHLLSNIIPATLKDNQDHWRWRLNSKFGFTVAQLRKIVDQ